MYRIIIEGPDGSGKTTLTKEAPFASFTRRHLSAPKGDPLEEVAEVLGPSVRGTNAVVHDRLHLSEDVYAWAYPGPNRGIRPEHKRLLERALLAEPSAVVLCLPPYEVAAKNWANRSAQGGEMYTEGFDRVYAGYTALGTSLPLLHYDYTTDSVAELWAMLADTILARFNGGPGVGSFREGNTLVVTSPALKLDPMRRKYGPWVAPTASDVYLAQALDARGVSEDGLYWVESVAEDGTRTDPYFLDLLSPKRVVAVGAVARDWCKRAGLTPALVPTPMEWRHTGSGTHPLAEAVL